MTRRHRSAWLLAALLLGCGSEPRSLFLLSADTLRADHLGCKATRAA